MSPRWSALKALSGMQVPAMIMRTVSGHLSRTCSKNKTPSISGMRKSERTTCESVNIERFVPEEPFYRLNHHGLFIDNDDFFFH
jgi:hypothetical protein